MRYMIGSFGRIATDGRRCAQGVKAVVALAIVLAVGVAAGADAAVGSLNGRISFTSFRDGGLGDIWTMNPDGTHLRKLTEGPLYDAQSDWSPDGQWIAFRRGPNASQRLGVWKMNLYGGAQTLLAQGDPAVPAQNVTQPAWSPDGRGLLFRASLPPFPDSDIWWMDTTGSGRHLVAHIAGEQLYPSYSPDMSTIAFTTPLTSTDRAIFTMAADGSRLSTVFDVSGAYDSAPAWSPDGEQIAFESDQDGDMEIYVMNVDGSDVRQMTDNTIHDEGPVWSPDGKRITFTSGPGDLDGDIWVMDSDGSGRTQLTDSPGRDESPDWQPIPHFDADRACGDATHASSGAYSVVATGRGLDCAKAHAVATRWSESALAGAADATVKGFMCTTTDAGYDALKVTCAHRGNRTQRPQRRGNRKSMGFIWRSS
jgi:Tol biopolymer transport system component